MESISYWKNSYQEAFSKKNINVTQIEIWKSIFERKKMGMEKLKNWDEISKNNIQMIKMLVDSMFLELDTKLNDSFNRYEKTYRFFSQIKMTFFSKLKFSADPQLFQFNNQTQQEQHDNQGFCSFFDFVDTFDKNLVSFQEQINSSKNEILQNINERILTEKVKIKENEIKQLFAEIKSLKLKLQKISLLTSNKLSNLMKAFKEYFVDSNKTKRPTMNVFEFVFSFMNHVRDVSEMIKEYGNLFVKLYEESKELERERLEAMGESFSFFFKIIRQNFSAELLNQFDGSMSLLGKINNTSIVDGNYSVAGMLQPSQQELIKGTLGSNAENISVISEFIKNSKYEENSKEIFKYFVLKIYKVEEINHKNDNLRQVILFLTIDYFYTIYSINEDTKEYELITRFPIEETELHFLERNIATLVFSERNFLWKSKKKICLRFIMDCQDEILMDHETFSLLLKTADITDDSQSTKLLNKSLDDVKDKSGGLKSPENSPEKAIKEDSKIELNILKLFGGSKRLKRKLAKIEEEKEEECFTDERSADVESKFSNDDLSQNRNKPLLNGKDKKSREI